MTPLRVFEVVCYSLLGYFPFMLLAIYPFRKELRLSPVLSVLVVLAGAAIHTLINSAKYVAQRQGWLTLICTVVHTLTLVLMVRNHYGKAAFTVLMLNNISNLVVVASKCLEGLLFPAMAVDHHRWTNSLTMAIVEAVVLIPLFFYFRNVYARALVRQSSETIWRHLWLIPLTFYAVWFRNFYFSEEGAMTLALRPQHTLFALVINGGALLTYTMIVRLIEEQEQNRLLREREHHLSQQRAQYMNMQDKIEEARRAKHDLRQHMHIMASFLHDKKYEEAENYLNRYRKTIPEDAIIAYCGNYAANTLIQYFAGYAKMIGVGFSASVQLPEELGIPEESLTVVLGNLLENAMEASHREENAVVSIRAKVDVESVFVKIVNTCSYPPKIDKEGRFLSTKGKNRVGVGLQSVRRIAESHGGMLDAHWADGKFTVSVMLNKDV